jgi:N-acetylglucosaminyl-diphospho-decaprenol L-rhamnosyltransferase
MSSRVAIVIPTYNSRQWIDGCLAAIATAEHDGCVVQVVDNGSTDGSAEYVEAQWPAAAVERLESNLGYGAAVNAGASLWPAHDVFALNVDTVARPGALDRLVRALAMNPALGAVAPRLLNGDGSLQRSGYSFPTLATFARQLVGLEPRAGSAREGDAEGGFGGLQEIDWAPGAAVLIRRAAWDAVGGFDPAYRFYVEEVDLQRRIHDGGWQVALEPSAEFTHFGGARPEPAARFALSHDGWERYFGSRSGRLRQVIARGLLCAIAASRGLAWLAVAAIRPARRDEALRWAKMFAGTLVLSGMRLPGAALRRHAPYAPPPNTPQGP